MTQYARPAIVQRTDGTRQVKILVDVDPLEKMIEAFVDCRPAGVSAAEIDAMRESIRLARRAEART